MNCLERRSKSTLSARVVSTVSRRADAGGERRPRRAALTHGRRAFNSNCQLSAGVFFATVALQLAGGGGAGRLVRGAPPGGGSGNLALLGDRGVTVITRQQPAQPLRRPCHRGAGPREGRGSRRAISQGDYFRIKKQLQS